MRRLWIFTVLALALMLPASTASASPYYSTVVKNICSYSGGEAGYGYLRLKVRAEERGKSGVSYFAFKTALQEYRRGSWVTVKTSGLKSASFPDDRDTYSTSYRAQASFPESASNYPPSRLVIRVQFWDKRPGPDLLLKTHKHVGKTC